MRVDAYDSHMCVCLSLLERAQKSRKKEKDPAKLTQQFNVRDKQTQTKRPLLRFVLDFLNIQSRLADISIVFESWNLQNFKTYIHLQRTNIKTSFQNFGATSRCGVLSLAFFGAVETREESVQRVYIRQQFTFLMSVILVQN